MVADKFEKSGLDGLGALGVEVLFEPDLKDQTLADRLAESRADVLVVRSTKVSREALEGSHLGLVIRAGAGYNTIDVAAASERGILVTNCPGKNSQAVAELAFGLLIAADRKIPDNVAQLLQGKWNKKTFSSARGLYGRTLGLIGMGKISQEMTTRAKAFGMQVATFSRWLTPGIAAEMGVRPCATVVELAQISDAVSVHVSLTGETRGMLGDEFFQAMQPGAIFVNTSRAEVVVQSAMEKAIKDRNLFAALDVFEGEPDVAEGTYDGSLKDNPRVYCTHHIGASTDQAQEAIAAEVVRIVKEFLATGNVPNVVNIQRAESATHLMVVRHQDRVGVLAHVLSVLKSEGVSVQEMENVVLGGAKAAIAQISVDKEPSPSALAAVKMNEHVFDASVMAISK